MPPLRSRRPASEESRCDKAITDIFGEGAVCRLGRKGKRTNNTEGVPDRLYWCGYRMIFFEVKSENDYLSAAQVSFLMRLISFGIAAGCGNRDDLLTLLNAPNPESVSLRQIGKYRTRQKAKRAPLSTTQEP